MDGVMVVARQAGKDRAQGGGIGEKRDAARLALRRKMQSWRPQGNP
jgi:hypothetical protein